MNHTHTPAGRDDDTTRAPEGYAPDDIALCQRLTSELVAEMRNHPGHVVLSALLTVYVQISSEYGGAARQRAVEYLVMVGSGLLRDTNAGADEEINDPTLIATAIAGFIASRRHGPTLRALLIAFKALAEKFPCCLAEAAAGAAQVGKELATTAALTNLPGSPHVH